MKVIDGKLSATGLRFGIALARFNGFFGDALLDGALDALRRSGAEDKDITVVKVPGAWELPIVAKKLAETKKFDAIIGLGVVIRGHTPHFEYVAGESAKGLATVSLQSGLPVINGIITTDTLEQAMERAGSKAGNKGYEAAITAIEMASVLQQIG